MYNFLFKIWQSLQHTSCEYKNILKISAILVHDRLCTAFTAGIFLWGLIESRR